MLIINLKKKYEIISICVLIFGLVDSGVKVVG